MNPEPAPEPRSPSLDAWPISMRQALASLLALALLVLGGKTLYDFGFNAGYRAGRPIDDIPSAQIDLNRAPFAELRTLPGIGETLARRILDDRDQRGPFRSLGDLNRVAGVGPKTIERLRPWLVVHGDHPLVVTEARFFAVPKDGEAMEPNHVKSVPNLKAKIPSGIIDINRADATLLQELPGIGPKISQRILDERTLRGPFKTVDELRRVSGIGAKTLEKIRPWVKVEETEITSVAN